MNNDEGGTDNEEFRVAAVIDRFNMTWETWQAITMECARGISFTVGKLYIRMVLAE